MEERPEGRTGFPGRRAPILVNRPVWCDIRQRSRSHGKTDFP